MHFFPPLFLQHYNSASPGLCKQVMNMQQTREGVEIAKTPWYPFARQKLKPIQQLLSMLMHSPRDVL